MRAASRGQLPVHHALHRRAHRQRHDPAGHYFCGAIESLTWNGKDTHDPGSAAVTSRAGRDSDPGSHDGRDGTDGSAARHFPAEPEPEFSRPNTAPAYYRGHPARLWIAVMRPRRGRTAPDHLMQAVTGGIRAAVGRTPLPPCATGNGTGDCGSSWSVAAQSARIRSPARPPQPEQITLAGSGPVRGDDPTRQGSALRAWWWTRLKGPILLVIGTAVGASDDLGRVAGRPGVGETTVTRHDRAARRRMAPCRSRCRETMPGKLRRSSYRVPHLPGLDVPRWRPGTTITDGRTDARLRG